MRAALLVAGIAAAAFAVTATSAHAPTYAWQETPTGSTARLRGLDAVSPRVAWASGSLGTVLRTTDRGRTWESIGPPGTESLQFRDIEAFDSRRAVILSIGPGADSRVYWTSNAGRSWTLAWVNEEPDAFYDCMTFFDGRRGLALSDPVDGRFRLVETNDGGRSWRILDAEMPPALPGEFAFAASGQCLVSHGSRRAWFATGGGAEARVFRTEDGGRSWKVASTPVRSGATAGIYALAFRDSRHGLAIGGDFTTPTVAPDALALTSDGGRSWRLVADAPNEYRSGAAWLDGRTAIAVGPTGSNVSTDRGRTWTLFDRGSYDTVDCTRGRTCWASGEQGRAAYLVVARGGEKNGDDGDD